MSDFDQIARVASAFASHQERGTFCTASADVLGVASAGVALMSGRHNAPVCHSDGRSLALAEAQFSLGEGPSLDAFATREVVHEPDLEYPQVARWPMFTATALELGTRGVFALPLNAGQRCIGVLTLYHDVAGPLTPTQAADGPVVADMVARAVLEAQSNSTTGLLSDDLDDTARHRAEVHQASGMVAVQLGMAVADAEARLRAHAYAENRSVADVARDIVERRLRLDDDGA